MNTAFDADSKNNLPVGHSGAGSPRVYQKGSIVIDMLRYVVGDEQFKIAIHDFLARYPYDNVESNDFEMQFMRSLGINVEWFFDEWIYRGGFPVYSVQYQKQTDFTQITIQQQQIQNGTIHLFKMPVHVQVHYLDLGLELKREDLIAIYNKENFFGIKSEIISQLANDDNKSSLALLKTALTDTNPLVRRAVISNIQTLHKSLEKSATTLLVDNNYTNIEIALTRLSTLNPDKTKKYLEVTANEKGATNNIRITWLEIANR
ncbi:MAG: hypothetical protein IPO24_16335, partial [Bacteroidetes bacterium]|nr:hypothetical protein [Bacteroidota bacterium]